MKKLITWACAAAAILVFAPISQAAPPASKGLYKAQLTGVLTAGKSGSVTLTITPAKGYKWNKEYPAKVELSDGTNVTFPKKKYLKVKNEIKGTDKAGTVVIKAAAKAAGKETLTATVSMSVCNKDTCKVLRKRKVPLTYTAK